MNEIRKTVEMSAPIEVNLPSGDVTQYFDFWSNFMRGAEIGNVTFDFGRTANEAVEKQILADVGSYGRQLGRIGEALSVLIDHFEPTRDLNDDEKIALEDLKAMLRDIAQAKDSCVKDEKTAA